jgi:hypothetical protein
MCVFAYEVTMTLWAECTVNPKVIVAPKSLTYLVQPPVWTHGDDVLLEICLNQQVKMKFLVDLRKQAQSSVELERIVRDNQFIVHGIIQRWVSPTDQDGNRRQKEFLQSEQLQAA